MGRWQSDADPLSRFDDYGVDLRHLDFPESFLVDVFEGIEGQEPGEKPRKRGRRKKDRSGG